LPAMRAAGDEEIGEERARLLRRRQGKAHPAAKQLHLPEQPNGQHPCSRKGRRDGPVGRGARHLVFSFVRPYHAGTSWRETAFRSPASSSQACGRSSPSRVKTGTRPKPLSSISPRGVVANSSPSASCVALHVTISIGAQIPSRLVARLTACPNTS